MCGITGVLSLEGELDPTLRQALRRMTDAIAHRGPDGDGFYDGPQVALGHRRLAIIDRAGGAQPMSNEDDSCWIVFNGEIYNHRILRPALESRGHQFRTHSDTETILHAYEEYGPAAVERLAGMFAFAIYSERTRELFLARDRVGKKPLYWTILDGALHFASEIAALMQSPAWRGEVELEALEGYLSLGYFLAPGTPWRGVYKLEPGCWMRVAAGRVETRRYWDVTAFDTDQRSPTELLPAVDALLGTAVRDRLESEVPLGAFLSGGIDSGLIVSYMAGAVSGRLVTTSVGFKQADHNELEPAALVAKHFDAEHHAEVIEPRLDEVFDAVIDNIGEPLADASAIPTWYVSRAARRHVTVALSGDGGDETFAGYDFRYVPHVLEGQVRRFVPRGPGRRLARWLGAHWPRSSSIPKALRAGTVLENLGHDPAAAYYLDLCFLKPADTRALLGLSTNRDPTSSPVYEAVTAPYRSCPSAHPLQRAQYADLKVYMPNDPLVKVDRMSMAHSLEIRCPLLDHRVVEFAFSIPAEHKLSGSVGKVLLRQLAATRLPPKHAHLPKRGFSVPIGEWIAGPYKGRFVDEVLGSTSLVRDYLDVQQVRRLLGDVTPERASYAYALWAVWVLERWLQKATSRHLAQATA